MEKYIESFKKSLYSVIPMELLQVFDPHEFEMILNGPNTIDLKDWEENTVYEGFTADS